MTKLRTLAIGVLLLAMLGGGTAFAQGIQDGTLSGTVTLSNGDPGPGVTVTVTSPALQGERTTITAGNGSYVLRGLPPGDYKVTFNLEGFKPEQSQVTVPLGGSARSDAKISPAALTETIQVVGEAANALETPSTGANLTGKTIDSLATPRDLAGIATLAPGVTTSLQTLLPGQVTISGGFAYDNLFLLNGVDINDSVFGNPNNLFIEDAIQETQVLASGISAEYGRFGGGVVNAITKSGGNTFSGTLRSDFSNPSYRDTTPLEDQRHTKIVNKNNEVYSGTLGGYIMKDSLWFFLAGRSTNADDQQALNQTGLPFDQQTRDRRYEGKLTANISNSQSLQASYIKNDTSTFQTSVDKLLAATPDTAVHESQPNDLKIIRYSGVLTSNLYAEAQYSEKKFEFVGAGGTDTDIHESPFRCASIGCVYNAPYFDATDPESRNNKQIAASLSYLVEGAGTHNLKVGGEEFKNLRTGGNSQSATNYTFFSDFARDANGNPILDAQGHLEPVFIPNTFQSFLVLWEAHRGSQFQTKTDAAYVNDEWKLNGHWSFNLGARYENVGNTGTDNVKNIHASALSPRLALNFDPQANGKYRLSGTYAEYAGAYNLALFTNGTNTGNPSYLYGPYIGPPGEGRNFAPGFDPHNYVLYLAGSPTQNVKFANNVSAPRVKEETLSAGVELPKGGFAKLTFINRKTVDFLENFISTDLGFTQIDVDGVPGPLADNVLYKNSNDPSREYQALSLEGRYPITSDWTVEGNWVHQIKNDGNYLGQSTQIIGTSGIDAYKELFSKERNFPVGHLPDYEADVARIWSIYHFGLGRAGDLSLSLLGNYNSPLTYSYAASNVRLTAQQQALDPGYKAPPRTQTIFFGKRGSQNFASWTTFDFAANYQIPVFRAVSPWLKVEVRNILNDKTLIGWDTTVIPDSTGPKDSLGLPTTFHRAASFGKPISNDDYPVPREYFFSVGIRF